MVDEHRDQPNSSGDSEDSENKVNQEQVEVEVETDGKNRFSESIDSLVDEVNKVVRVAIVNSKSTAESIGENIRDTVQNVRSNRDNVVMVRMDDDSLSKVDELVEAGIVNSRSEAAALLVTEGIKSKQGLFDRIAAKVEEIRKAKEELRQMVQNEPEN